MKTRITRFGLFLAWGVATLVLAAAPVQADEADLQRQLDVLADELSRLREEMSIPATDEAMHADYGMGPAASKVYGVSEGISMGGYGEFYFAAPIEETEESGATNVADTYRFITYFGYKFDDRIVMNTEIEIEHANEISVEFAYLDFLLDPRFNVRAGNLLIPSGFVNLTHEPPFYRGNFRPELERRIIPSTWRELGVGAHGRLAEGVEYTAYLVNGFDAAGFSSSGVRGGRQKGSKAAWEDVAGIVRLDVDHGGRAGVSGSFYIGQSDQNQVFDDDPSTEAIEPVSFDVTNWIGEVHGYFRGAGFEARALFAMAGIDGADDLSRVLDTTVPERQMGWYVDVAYDITPMLLGEGATTRLAPWVRYEDFNLQDEVASGFTADPARDQQLLSLGLDVKPHPNVVLKAEYVHKTHEADSKLSDEVRVGAGFVY